MPNKLRPLLLTIFLSVCFVGAFFAARAQAEVEVFGKGSVSKNYLASDTSTVSVSVTGGIAMNLLSFLRIEGRYTNISSLQNKLDINNVGTLSDVMNETNIYSLGVDVEFGGEKATIAPYVYLGVGYIETTRSYYFTPQGTQSALYLADPKQDGVSLNAGLGLRLRIVKALAIELEAYAYATNIKQASPLINWYGTAGVRIFI